MSETDAPAEAARSGVWTRYLGVWTRYLGVSLVHVPASRIAEQPALVRALTDGWDRSAASEMPEVEGDWLEVREGRETVGVALVRRDCPRRGQAALLAVGTAREARGRAVSTKTVLAAERKLASEGFAPLLVRVPRTNGRGLYFMLRCGFTPVPAGHRPDDEGDATWFARRGALDRPG